MLDESFIELNGLIEFMVNRFQVIESVDRVVSFSIRNPHSAICNREAGHSSLVTGYCQLSTIPSSHQIHRGLPIVSKTVN